MDVRRCLFNVGSHSCAIGCPRFGSKCLHVIKRMLIVDAIVVIICHLSADMQLQVRDQQQNLFLPSQYTIAARNGAIPGSNL